MQDDEITIRFAAHDKSGKSDLTAAELGALMTGVSRSLNKLYLESPQCRDEVVPNAAYTERDTCHQWSVRRTL
jgi:hypothetical protein